MKYHKLLAKQIKKFLKREDNSHMLRGLESFLEDISSTYHLNDKDRDRVARALDLTSKELNDSYKKAQEQIVQMQISHDEQKELLKTIQSVLQASNEGLLLTDVNNKIIFLNDTFLEMFDISFDDINTGDYEFIRAVIKDKVQEPNKFIELLRKSTQDPAFETAIILNFKDGRVVEVRSINRVLDGELLGRMWNFEDITESRYIENTSSYRAYHDALTNMPNRYLLFDKIRQLLNKQKVSKDFFALFYIDLDGFKFVNDTLGHGVGDAVLIELANRIQEIVDNKGMVARYGGDEFLAIVESYNDIQELEQIAEDVLEAISMPYYVDTLELFLSASIGIAVAPENGDDVDTLIKSSDLAMSYAKSDAKNCYKFFELDMERESSKELFLKAEINHALQNKEFSLFYQPKIDMKTQKIIGAEALIRWFKADNTMIPPNDFIGVAERCGLIIPISEWVFEEATRQISQWSDLISDDFVLSVNVSALHLKYPNIVEQLKSVLDQYNIRPNQIELEITESVVIDSPQHTIKKLEELRDHGFSLAIDDFGTGYSSFNYLKMLPINQLKIDRSFITEIETSSKDLSLVEGIVDIAHALDLTVVTEGIETEKSHDLLESIGCDTGQGYLYGRPVSASEFEQLLINPVRV